MDPRLEGQRPQPDALRRRVAQIPVSLAEIDWRRIAQVLEYAKTKAQDPATLGHLERFVGVIEAATDRHFAALATRRRRNREHSRRRRERRRSEGTDDTEGTERSRGAA